jgi:hypothetical protein
MKFFRWPYLLVFFLLLVQKPAQCGEGMTRAYVKTNIRRCGDRIWCKLTLQVGRTFHAMIPLRG